MTIALPSAPGFRMLVKQIASPPPIVTRDPTFHADTHYYEDQVTLTVPFAVAATEHIIAASLGTLSLDLASGLSDIVAIEAFAAVHG